MTNARDARWVLGRTREVWQESGVRGVARRGSGYLSRQRAAMRKRLPTGPVDSSTWPASVTIIAGRQPPQCFRYRVLQKLEAAEGGVPVRVADPGDPDQVSDAVSLARILVIFRQPDTPVTRAAVAQARRLGIPVVYEADDAVHDRSLLAGDPNLATLPGNLRRSVVRGADRHRSLLRECDHVLAATPELAAALGREVPGSAFVMENGVDRQMRTIAAGLRADPAPPRPPDDGRVVIGYGSGSRAHDADFAVAAPGLARVMAGDQRVTLLLVGPVALPSPLQPFADRIDRFDSLDYGEFLRQLAACDIAIAPLLDLPFNRYKSQVKMIEAAVVGTALVASPPVYADHVVDGVTGLLAPDDGWAETLRRLVVDGALRGQLATAAAASVTDLRVEHRPRRQWNDMITALQ
ncbi:MAG: glycosyltransferase [Candidatus Nanopelagicales bacterium]